MLELQSGTMSYNIGQVVIYMGGCLYYKCDLLTDIFSSIVCVVYE